MRVIQILWSAWRRFGHRVAAINGALILTLFYLFALTPYALLLRLVRRDPLGLHWGRNATSYWRTRTATPAAADSYKRPF